MGMETCERAARVSRAKTLGVKYQEDYEYVLAEAAEIRLDKAHTYGEARYEEPDHDFNMSGVFWDIYRKFIRLRQMFKLGWRAMSKRPDGLRDALLDMANYCIMGVQLIDKYVGKAPKRSPFFIEQVAIHCKDPDKFKKALGLIGLTDWSEDRVEAVGEVWGRPAESTAILNFNYQLGPFELELIKYEEGSKNWLDQRDAPPALSHLGLHIDASIDMDDMITQFQGYGINVAQKVSTMSHTNPAIKDSRRYRYVIFDTIDLFGFDLKLIQRLTLTGEPFDPEAA